MLFNDEDVRKIETNNLVIERLNEKIDKKKHGFPLKLSVPMALAGLGVMAVGLISFIPMTLGVEELTGLFSVEEIIGSGMFASSLITMLIANTSIIKLQDKIKILEQENKDIKNKRASSILREAIVTEDFSLVDNEVINMASKKELSTALKVLVTKEQSDNVLPLMPTTLTAEKRRENELDLLTDTKTPEHSPKTLSKTLKK